MEGIVLLFFDIERIQQGNGQEECFLHRWIDNNILEFLKIMTIGKDSITRKENR